MRESSLPGFFYAKWSGWPGRHTPWLRLPDYYGLYTAFSDLEMVYLIRQLDMVASYWRATALERQQLAWGHDQNDLRMSLDGLRRMLALYFLVDAQAWKLLCADLKIDPEAILRDAPGYQVLQEMEIEAREVAFRPEEAMKFLRKHFRRLGPKGDRTNARYEFQVPAAAEVARSMRATLEENAKQWS